MKNLDNMNQWVRNGITLDIVDEGDSDARYWVVRCKTPTIVCNGKVEATDFAVAKGFDMSKAIAAGNEWADRQLGPQVANWENSEISHLAQINLGEMAANILGMR